MKEFRITAGTAGQTSLKYITKLLPLAPLNLLHKSIRKKNITLNNKKCSGKEILNNNDTIQIWFSDETFSLFSKNIRKKRVPKQKNLILLNISSMKMRIL